VLVLDGSMRVYHRTGPTTWVLLWSQDPLAPANSFQGSAAISPNGFIMAVDTSGVVRKYSFTGTPLGTYTATQPTNIFIAMDVNDNIYFTGYPFDFLHYVVYGLDSSLTPLPGFPFLIENQQLDSGPSIGSDKILYIGGDDNFFAVQGQ